MDIEQSYEPDFLVRLANGVPVALEIMGLANYTIGASKNPEATQTTANSCTEGSRDRVVVGNKRS
jgi:hypothetical protein